MKCTTYECLAFMRHTRFNRSLIELTTRKLRGDVLEIFKRFRFHNKFLPLNDTFGK